MSVESEAAPVRPPAAAGRPRRSRTFWVVLAAVVALLLLTAVVVVVDWLTHDGRGGAVGGGDRVVAGPRDGREQATFVLLDATKSITVRTGDLGDRLFRVQTPDGGDRIPRVAVVGDEVKVGFADTGRGGVSVAEVQLNSAVRWNIRVLAGATEQVVDLTGGKVAGLELAGGATRIELTLPPPEGTTTVRMSGGVAQWTVHRGGDAPVRVRVGSGAGNVTVDGVPHNGISGGTVLSPPGWDAAQNRIDIDAVAGMSSLVVDRR